MSSPQPERHLPHAAPAAGQNTGPLSDAVIRAAVENAIEEAKRHGASPHGVIGSASPVAQPGRPAMSQRATDASVMMITAGFLSLCVGIAGSAVLYFSGTANPVVVGLLCAAPPAAFLSVRGLMKGLKRLIPDQIHNHYEGTVYQDQRNVRTSTRGVWAKTNNQQ